jgi:hypothetical protein
MTIEFAKMLGKNQKFKNEADALRFFEDHGIDTKNIRSTKDKKGNIIFSFPHIESFILQDAEVK